MIDREALLRVRACRKVREMRRGYRLRGESGLRCVPLVSGHRDPLRPRTDAPDKWFSASGRAK